MGKLRFPCCRSRDGDDGRAFRETRYRDTNGYDVSRDNAHGPPGSTGTTSILAGGQQPVSEYAQAPQGASDANGEENPYGMKLAPEARFNGPTQREQRASETEQVFRMRAYGDPAQHQPEYTEGGRFASIRFTKVAAVS